MEALGRATDRTTYSNVAASASKAYKMAAGRRDPALRWPSPCLILHHVMHKDSMGLVTFDARGTSGAAAS